MMKRKTWIALLLIALLVLAGCGAGSNEKPAEEAAEEVEEATEEAAAETEAAAEETAEEAPAEETAEKATEETPAEETAEEATEEATSQVATAEEMTTVDEVVEDWMVPITADSLNDGTYDVVCESSSSMFKIAGCTLTVENGEMTAVLTMGGKGYTYVYPGTGEEAAAADESAYIQREENAEGAHTFTVPVEALDKGLDLAAFSTKKEKWYERTIVFRSDSLPLDAFREGFFTTAESLGLADGEYQVEIELTGGSGKASLESPTKLVVSGGVCTATLTWSSPNYDYMIVDGEKYLPVNTEGNSVFEVPVSIFDRFVPVAADTTAMSTPHEIDYLIRLDSASVTQ
ncbi:MAG: hypothetical protein IJM69_06225 [Firmicutes bacterium]|nr:hypothetical protein [Bacillota bacterium]